MTNRAAKLIGFISVLAICASAFAQVTPTARIITKTTISSNTSTPVCSSAGALQTQIQVQTGNVGLGLRGQTLTGATYGTGTSDPDVVISAAGAQFVDAWGVNAPITAYSATSQVVICIQTVRG